MTKAWRMTAITVAFAVWLTYSVPVHAAAPGRPHNNLSTAPVVQTDDDDDDMSGGALAVLLLAIGGAVAGVLYAAESRNSLTFDFDAGNTATVSIERTEAGRQKSRSAWMASLNRASGMIRLTSGGTNSLGRTGRIEWIGKADGKYYPVKGHSSAQEFAFTKVDARTFGFSARTRGRIKQSGRIVISANGRSYAISNDQTDSIGRRTNRRAVYAPR